MRDSSVVKMRRDYIQRRTGHCTEEQLRSLGRLDVELLLSLYFRLVVGGGGQRDVGAVEVARILALVSLVLALALVVVADAQQHDADDYQQPDGKSTCRTSR